jgi:hypothetical protein
MTVKNHGPDHHDPDKRPTGGTGAGRPASTDAVQAVLKAGGGFATTSAAILGTAGALGVGERQLLYALAAICVIAALTMFTAVIMRR